MHLIAFGLTVLALPGSEATGSDALGHETQAEPYQATEFNTLNRNIRMNFGPGCWPEKLYVNEEAVFASAPVIHVSDKSNKSIAIEWKTKSTRPDGTATGTGSINGSNILNWRRSLKQDGFVKCDFDFMSLESLGIYNLALEYLITPNVPKYFSHYLNYDYIKQLVDWSSIRYNSGILNTRKTLEFTPVLWLGNSEIGLEFITETNENWIGSDNKPKIDIVREDGHVSTVFNLIVDQNVTENYTYSFAIFPTGGSNIRSKKSSQYVISSGETDDKFIHKICSKNSVKFRFLNWSVLPIDFPGLPGSSIESNDEYVNLVVAAEKFSSKSLVYSSLYIMPATHPAISGNRYNLGNNKPRKNKGWAGRLGVNLPVRPVNLNDKRFRNFLIQEHLSAANQIGFDGIYIDAATPYIPSSKLNKNTNKKILKYPLFSHRDFVVQYHKILKRDNPEFVIAHHAPQIPHFVRPYVDVIVIGEIWNRMFAQVDGSYNPDYTQIPSDALIDFQNNTGSAKFIMIPQVLKKNASYLKRNPELYRKWTNSAVEFATAHGLGLWHTRLDRSELTNLGSDGLLPCQ